MTVLMGAYNADRTDVAIITDRLSMPTTEGRFRGFTPDEEAVKTKAISSECAIGFSGNGIVQEIVLHWLAGCLLDEGVWRFPVLRSALDEWLPQIASEMPVFNTAGIVIAGKLQDVPILGWYCASTHWQAKPCFVGEVYFSPIPLDARALREEMEAQMHSPGLGYVERMQVPIWFCAARCDSVNNRYALRRLSRSFMLEEGVAYPPTSAE